MKGFTTGPLMGKHAHTGLSLDDAIKLARTAYADKGEPQSVCIAGRAWKGHCVWSVSLGEEQHGIAGARDVPIGTPFVPDAATVAAMKKAGVL